MGYSKINGVDPARKYFEKRIEERILSGG